jgi:hypothetical protein
MKTKKGSSKMNFIKLNQETETWIKICRADKNSEYHGKVQDM